jgi:hypothetical protein
MLYDDHSRFVTNYNLLRMWRNQWELYMGKKDGHEADIVQFNSYEEFMTALNELKAELEENEHREERETEAIWEEV